MNLVWAHSEVTLLEYVELVCTYNKHISTPRIDPKLRDKRYTDKQLEQLNKKLGTEKLRSLNLVVPEPGRFSCPEFGYYFELYTAFKAGILPYEGPLTQQPNKVIEIFNILASLESENQLRQYKQAQAKANAKRSVAGDKR